MLHKRSKFYGNAGIAEYEQRQRLTRQRQQAAIVKHEEERKLCKPEDSIVKKALLVGFDNTVNVISTIVQILIRCYGYKYEDIVVMNNPNNADHLLKPTRVNVLRQFRKLLLTQGLTHFFFYFAGLNGLQTCDAPVKHSITIDEIYNLIQTLPVTAKATCILDTALPADDMRHACLGYAFNRQAKLFERVDRPLASVPTLISLYRTGGQPWALGHAMCRLISTPNANTYQDVLHMSGAHGCLSSSRMILAAKILEL